MLKFLNNPRAGKSLPSEGRKPNTERCLLPFLLSLGFLRSAQAFSFALRTPSTLLRAPALRFLKSFLRAALALCPAFFLSGAQAEENFWTEDVWKKEDRTFLYYPDAQKKDPRKDSPVPLSELKSASDIKAEHARRLEAATFNPTEENVLAFQQINYFVQEKAALFTDVFRRLNWQNPQFDFSVRHPAANFAQVALEADKKAQRNRDLQALSSEWGIVYFYKASCRFCSLQSPLVKRLQTEYGFEVLAVSLDGSPNEHFPDALPDNGISGLLTAGAGLTQVPAVFMVRKDQRASFLVSSGVLALEDMLLRIQNLALKGAGGSLFGGSLAGREERPQGSL